MSTRKVKQSGRGNERPENQLAGEASPYLRQHADNPVHWQVWGERAFEQSRAENKPIFLSIGYSTCHWCHVMAHESFENQDVAEFLNEHFVSIKVDREERPDVDQVYMAACHLLSGSGGWPLSFFLLPDLRPFYGGTYFPPQAYGNRPGFLQLLQSIHQAWQDQQPQLKESAGEVLAQLKQQEVYSSGPIDDHWVDRGARQIADSIDTQYGGFGHAPKFPRPVVPDFLLRHGKRLADSRIQAMAQDNLRAMAWGGIHDQVGGGFHRYSVDEAWQVPHFEKMLYDQAQLASSYLLAFEQTSDPFFARIARSTLDSVMRDLRDVSGTFYCGEDADSPDLEVAGQQREGAFYLWRHDELSAHLLPDDLNLLELIYGIASHGNVTQDPHQEFSHWNILYRQADWRQNIVQLRCAEEVVEERLDDILSVLQKIRSERPRPHRDEKILVSWNGLMISALARAARVLGDESFLKAATQAADFFVCRFQEQGLLQHWWRPDGKECPAGLADYTFLVQGLLDLYQAENDQQWLDLALQLSRVQEALFADGRGGLNDFQSLPDILLGGRSDYDGAEPAPGSVAVMNYLRLGQITGDPKWTCRGEEVLGSFAEALNRYPAALPHLLTALEYRQQPW